MNLPNPKTDVLKEPRGFIKVIQFFMAILAFATCVDWRGHLELDIKCMQHKNVTKRVSYTFKYPFDFEEKYINQQCTGEPCKPLCEGDKPPEGDIQDFEMSAVSQSQFFVFIGVIAWLSTIAITFGYVFYEDMYLSSPRLIWGDILVHGLLAFFWFVSVCAFASKISSIKYYTSKDFLIEKLSNCQDKGCTALKEPNYANLNIAALVGFVDAFLWAANIWFLFKETRQNKEEFLPDQMDSSPNGYDPYSPPTGNSGQWGSQSGQWGGPMPGQEQQSSVQGGLSEMPGLQKI